MEKEKIIKALLFFGMSSDKVENKAEELMAKGIKFNDIVKEFVRRIDQNPKNFTTQNCSDGKCYTTEIKK